MCATLLGFDSIYNSEHFDSILPRHEQGAGHMAQGYARASGKPGVVLVTSGPGATNVITSMQDALSDGTPIVVFTGQVVTSAIGLDAYQECDIAGISRTKQPIIYAGQGIIQSKGGPELLREPADKCSILVIITLQGLSGFNKRDKKLLHMLDTYGIAYANMSIQEADLIIALGVRFDDRVDLNTLKFAPNAKGILPKNINKVIQATEATEGDVTTNLKMLMPMPTPISMEQRSEWFNKISGWKAKWPLSNYERADYPEDNGLIKPQSLIEKLSDLTSKIDKKTIIPTGLSTATQFNIGVKVIILNNEEQGTVTQWQNLFYEDRYAHSHQRNPNNGPALFEVATDKKVLVLPMVPASAGLHEFSVYDREKDKARLQLMRERTGGLHCS
ncbi:DHS-like NAD/FAD-binding domain-containing protein [Trichoderma austrokoningii]